MLFLLRVISISLQVWNKIIAMPIYIPQAITNENAV